ncbi:DUF5412 domain-containing protein [Domibacillus sp. A3M-37]|uniref:DUF5412 family protein n=1 Tax=Domibacillus sp. A3M-37 TaxID=2962037 RepID=UPI0020B6C71A|nr:DUF5412 family protein [Domibacillus sp. A3M-37]MCP3764971.1 DUF5412 domain-containing protein [Domibacillus sp. A3M-37]
MKKALIVGLISLFSIPLLIVVLYQFQQDPEDLPLGILVKEIPSPTNEAVIHMYLVDEGGATSRYQMRGEVIYANKESKNIYFNYDEERTDVQWIDEQTVIINGEKLDIKEDFYYWKDDPDWEKKRKKMYEL